MRSVALVISLTVCLAWAAFTTPYADASSSVSSSPTTCVSIEQFGGGTSVTDNSPALTAALQGLPQSGGCVAFTAGKYAFASPVNFTFPSAAAAGIRLNGASKDATILNWASGSGLTFNLGNLGDSFVIANLTFTTSSAGGSTVGLTVNGPSSGTQPMPAPVSTLSDVSFRGDDCYACKDYWGVALYLNGWSNVNLVNPTISGPAPTSGGYSNVGVGISLSSGAAAPGVQYNIFGGNFDFLLYGIEYGGYSQGLTVNQSNFVGSAYGIYIPINAGVDQLNVTNCQLNSSVADIADNSGVLYDQISNNVFLVAPGAAGLYLQANYGFNIVGNTFVGQSTPNTAGVIINKHIASSGIITGNLFSHLSTGVWLASGSANVSLQSNVYTADGTPYLDNGTGNSIGVATP